ncbi:MAG: hypothetical protein ABFD83_02865 [Armatimonadota bacterium]
MAQDAIELIETPETCVVTTEYDNRIEDDIEIEPEQEEQEDIGSYHKREEIEQQFARYERNYRARRIREITLAPVKRKRGRPSKMAA